MNSRRQPKRFGAGSVVGNNSANSNPNNAVNSGNNNSIVSGGVNNNIGMNINSVGGAGPTGQVAIGSKLQGKFKSSNSPTALTKTFY